MRPIPLVRVWGLLPFVRFLERIGSPVEPWLEQSGISVDLLETPDRSIPLAFALQFFELAARREGAETFGIDVGRQGRAEDLGDWGLLLNGCETLYDRVAMFCRIQTLLNTGYPARFEVVDDEVWLRMRAADGLGPESRHMEDYSLMLVLEAIARVADPGWRPREIRLGVPRSARFRHDELFQGVNVVFNSPELVVTFPVAFLSRPMKPSVHATSASEDLWDRVATNAPPDDGPGSIAESVNAMLIATPPSIPRIAELMNTSTRTLQRQLKQDGLSLSSIVDRVRLNRAVEMLRAGSETVTDIAFELGYSNPPAFTRAFRRWTGLSPIEFQREAQES